jgi:hypothetical protein
MNEIQAQQVQANMVQAQQLEEILGIISAIAFIVLTGKDLFKMIMPKAEEKKG